MSGTGRVVAELGRPETPEETAGRKARDRALRRSRQTARNLAASLAVCVGLVVVIVLAVPRGDAPATTAIDYRAAAARQTTADRPLLAPAVPAGWQANAAEIRGTGSSAAWYVGFVTADRAFAAYSEGLPGDAASLRTWLDSADPTGTTSIGGLRWRVYDRTAERDTGNVAYGLATVVDGTVVAVYGTAPPAELKDLAARLAADAAARGLEGTNTLP